MSSLLKAKGESSEDFNHRLLKELKKEVKQIMEEAVTRKFINEDSSSVTSFCATVDACLLCGLKRRILGLFGSSSTFGLLHKISKMCPPAAAVVKMVMEIQQQHFKNRGSTFSLTEIDTSPLANGSASSMRELPANMRYLWIRLALFEKVLSSIVDYIARNASRFYEKDALMMDTVFGSMMATLIVGPCALEFSKMKTQDHFWTDPPADELIQRHKLGGRVAPGNNSPHPTAPHEPIEGGNSMCQFSSSTPNGPLSPTRCQPGSPLSPKSPRPSLQLKRASSLSQEDMVQRLPVSAREYVVSLHQNYKSTLLYGKNNVTVHPSGWKFPLQGYLSLHQNANGTLSIRWTPNQLMHSHSAPDESPNVKTHFWKHALNLNLSEIVYLHCHQQGKSAGSIVFVGADGVQYPPIIFPEGGHPLQFLACLENGLLPWAQLDPPLWLQKGKGKVYPRLRRRSSMNTKPEIESATTPSNQSIPPSPTNAGLVECPPGAMVVVNGTGSVNDGQVEMKKPDDVVLAEDGEVEMRDFVFRIVPCIKSEELARTLPKTKRDSQRSSNSRVVSLSNFSNKLKGRFLSMHSGSAHDSDSSCVTPLSSTADISRASSTIDGSGRTTPISQFSPVSSPPLAKKSTVDNVGDSPVPPSQITNGPLCPAARGDPSGDAADSSAGCSTDALPLTKRHSAPVLNATDLMEEDSQFLSDIPVISPTRSLIKTACESMRHQILYRAFYGWLAHCRHLRTVRTHLSCLVADCQITSAATPEDGHMVSSDDWRVASDATDPDSWNKFLRNVYYGGVEHELRTEIWPFLLGFYPWPSTAEDRSSKLTAMKQRYELAVSEWLAVEAIVQQRDREAFNAVQEAKYQAKAALVTMAKHPIESVSSDVFDEDSVTTNPANQRSSVDHSRAISVDKSDPISPDSMYSARTDSVDSSSSSFKTSVSSSNSFAIQNGMLGGSVSRPIRESDSSTPEKGDGGLYSKELIDIFAINVHRIEKDVDRCDRNYPYFTRKENLEKLKGVMCTYVWENMEMGYVQGMCDLAAPLLVIFDDEVMTYGCFCEMMKLMSANFPHGGAMDRHLANMRSLIQVLDPELFELMHQNGDYTHFYFCYRWFLLDFKRELVYKDVFRVWETIWAARRLVSPNFEVFVALALVEYYRDIILDNNMDFTDIIKFFNEMAERHDALAVLNIARDLLLKLHTICAPRPRAPPADGPGAPSLGDPGEMQTHLAPSIELVHNAHPPISFNL